MLKLESQINTILANVIKSIPEYTYDELKKLKDKGMLIPGQKYLINDYKPFFRQSSEWVESASDDAKGKIIIKAITQYEFDERVLLIRGGLQYHCKYCFDRNPLGFNWCPREHEWEIIREPLPTGSSLMEYRKAGPSSMLNDLITNAGNRYIFYMDGASAIRRAVKVEDGTLYEVVNTSNLTSLNRTVDNYVDGYRGIIYELVYEDEPKRLPYDPFHFVYFTEEFSGVKVEAKYPIVNLLGSSIYIGDNISGVNTPGTYYNQPQRKLPLIQITGLRGVTSPLTKLCRIYIGQNCSKIIANMSYGGSLYIEGNCTNVYLRFVNANISANSSRIYIQWPVQSLNLIGTCTDVTIRNSSYMNISADPLVMPCNIEVNSSKNLDLDLNLQALPKANVVVCPLQLTEKTTISLKDTAESNFDGCLFIGRDSNSNIMQWNPADVVDAVDVEEQIVENVEE